MKKNLMIATVALLMAACDNTPKFCIEGTIENADQKTIYFESASLSGIQVLDSVKLNKSGKFQFKSNRPEFPEFYRLQMEGNVINLAVDSTETIRLNSSYPNVAINYTVEGSEKNQQIKELTLRHSKLQADVNQLIKDSQEGRLPIGIFEQQLSNRLNEYKNEIKRDYIFKDPASAASYLALFQKVNGYLIFDPLNTKEDVQCFAAVATNMRLREPESVRTKNLCNIALKGMKNTRTTAQQGMNIPEALITETGVIDIELKDMSGNTHQLTDLKGKVVLLDFCAYQTTIAAQHNLALRELYNKYQAQGLQIYQVSLDADEHFWKTSADNLPWICVRDPKGIYSSYAQAYDIKELPSFFLINKNNELYARGENIKDIEATIKSLLR